MGNSDKSKDQHHTLVPCCPDAADDRDNPGAGSFGSMGAKANQVPSDDCFCWTCSVAAITVQYASRKSVDMQGWSTCGSAMAILVCNSQPPTPNVLLPASQGSHGKPSSFLWCGHALEAAAAGGVGTGLRAKPTRGTSRTGATDMAKKRSTTLKVSKQTSRLHLVSRLL